MSIPPGRVGNLTPEQEEKLFELWRLVFQVCGVEDEGVSEAAAEGAPTALQAQTSTASSDKPKKDKKRLGLFKKKDKKDKEGSAEKVPGSLEAIKDSDPDDKYGHNKVFQETLANRSPESIRASLWSMVKMDHPDQLVLRFLRARKWDVQKALIMLVSTMKWRQDAKVDDDIMLHGEEHFLAQEQSGATEKDKKFAKDFLDQMRMGKSFSHGIDKDGRPMTVVRTRLHRAGEQSEESLERYTIYLIETNRHLLSAPVDTGTVIFDMTGFSMANMDYTPVKFMIQCFEANYPESLGVVLVHKAPWVFQGFWKIIKGWLDPVVASKIHFTNNLKDMSEFVTASRVPKELDGEDSWEYQYVEPTIGENAKLKDTATRDRLLEERDVLYDEYEQATLHWLREKDAAKRTAVQAERSEIARKLKEGYWTLDPFVRSRSLYDRVGILNEGGRLDYYSWNKSPAAGVATTSAPALVETAADDVD
ncbi:phosphatidylinositol transfer protein CSR1 [Pestalotiopsis sp. NC0098]|nr:phosphatidylinositol transfer protein CSR1 [Pestalotiopsis sp. NC0098]